MNKEVWKGMSLPQKIGYIKDYYWLPISLGLVLLIGGIFFLTDAMRERAETALHVIVVESEMDRERHALMQEELTEYLDLDPDQQVVEIEIDLSGTENESSAATVGAYFISGRTDIVICKEDRFNAYAVAGYLKSWDKEDYELEADRYFYAVKREYDGGAITEIVNDPHDDQAEGACIYGFYLKNDPDWVVGLLRNAPNPERAVKSMDYFINLNNLLK